ncbi:WG repeat-containing protein [Salinisphaera hydrothermalis]|uniref:WG repeat-containing protein n=1 Tax=Salinisphaera hydrothermalis TaxID=563188 RepID=UPI003340AC1F
MAPRAGLYEINAFSEGRARVGGNLYEENLSGFGFLDPRGHYVVKPQYDEAGNFHDGRAAVARQEVHDKVVEKWGYVDRNGKTVIDLQYARAHAFSDGLAAVETQDGDWQFIDRSGRHVLDVDSRWYGVDADNPNLHHPLGDFHDGWLLIVDERGGNNFVDRDGHKLRDEAYPAAERFSDGLAMVSIHATTDPGPKGDNALSRIYNNLPGPAPKTYEWAVIDTQGHVRFRVPDDIDRLGPFINGRARFYRNGKWGVLDDKGQVIIPARYEHKPRGYGRDVMLFAVDGKRSNNSDGYIETYDRDGHLIARIPFVDDQGRFMIDGKHRFHEGLLGVELASGLGGDKPFKSLGWGFIDAHGNVVVEPQFDWVSDFDGGHAFVSPKDTGTVGIIRNPVDAPQSANDS